MAEGDLTLTARLRLEVDPNQIRAEMQKAGGIMGQAAGGGGGISGSLAQRTGGGQDSTGQMLRVLGLGAVGGGAIVGSYIVLQRILRLMENSPLFGTTFDIFMSGITTFFGAIVDTLMQMLGLMKVGQSLTIGLYSASASLRQGSFIEDAAERLYYLIWPNAPRATGAGTPVWKPGPDYYTQSQADKLWGSTGSDVLSTPPKDTLAWLRNLGPSSVYAAGGDMSPLGTTPFMMQWAAENPGGGIGMGGPPVVGGMRSAGTYSTLLSQLLKGTSLAQTSQWGNTDIGAQGQWWGPSADSGAIMNRIQKYYQVANYGGAGGTQWGDVSKLVEKFLSDPGIPDRSPAALFNQISGRIEPLGRTWWRSSEYGNSMADVMTMGSPGITPPDIGTLFSGLTFAPEIKVTIGAQELNDIITQIIESGNFTTRTAI